MFSPDTRASRRSLATVFFGLIVAALLFFTAPSFFAQTNDNGTALRGRVTDVAGAALPGASVTLSNLTTGLERLAVTDTGGNFAFATSRNGRYRLTVSAAGFAPVSREVEVGSSPALDFALEPDALAEKITVVSGSRQEELRESLNTKVDVIGHNRIRDTGYESVAEVLQELPGIVTRRGSQGAGAAGEQAQGIDLTAFRPALGRRLFFYKNIAKAVTQGVEFDGDLSLSRGFSLGGAYTHLNARDTANKLPLLNRHKHQGHARLAWESNARIGLRANLRGIFYSKVRRDENRITRRREMNTYHDPNQTPRIAAPCFKCDVGCIHLEYGNFLNINPGGQTCPLTIHEPSG